MLRPISALVLACALLGCDSATRHDNAELRAHVDEMATHIDVLNQRITRLEHQQLEAAARAIAPPGAAGGPAPGLPSSADDPLGAAAEAATAVPFTARCEGTQCKVSRAAFEALMNRPAGLAGVARIVPNIKNDETHGFKLFAIRPESPLARLGFQNGDMVREFNGMAVDSMDRALEAFAKLRHATTLTVVGERHGAPLRVVIIIE